MNNKLYYFASSNSMSGFKSYFDIIYDPKKLERIYIIKGGPGTGKSSMMKAIAECFEDKCNCEYFLCSSDINSLDGIIINGRVAIIDATSPHAVEARYPGSVEILVDNMNVIGREISKRRKEIISLNEKKAIMYNGAYAYLKAAGEIKKEYAKIFNKKVDIEKLDAAISRYFKQNYKIGKGYVESVRLVEGITPIGNYNTQSYEKGSVKKTIIINGKGYEEIIYKRFIDKAKEYGLNTQISYDPLLPYSVNAINFPDAKMCITNYSEKIHGEIDYDEYKVFNCERFIDKNAIIELKPKIKFASKCIQAMECEACEYLNQASSIHKELESIYSEYTDFGAVDENTNIILNELSHLV